MYCPNCGAFIEEENALFCGECGEALNIELESTAFEDQVSSGKMVNGRALHLDNKLLAVIIVSLSLIICTIIVTVGKSGRADTTNNNQLSNIPGTVYVEEDSNNNDSVGENTTELESIISNEENINQATSEQTENITSERSYEEKIMYGSFDASYIDVYPEEVTYRPAYIDMWEPEAGHILNLRSGPGSKYDLIDQIENEEAVIMIFMSAEDYCFIYYPDANEYGWVLSKYIFVLRD